MEQSAFQDQIKWNHCVGDRSGCIRIDGALKYGREYGRGPP